MPNNYTVTDNPLVPSTPSTTTSTPKSYEKHNNNLVNPHNNSRTSSSANNPTTAAAGPGPTQNHHVKIPDEILYRRKLLNLPRSIMRHIKLCCPDLESDVIEKLIKATRPEQLVFPNRGDMVSILIEANESNNEAIQSGKEIKESAIKSLTEIILIDVTPHSCDKKYNGFFLKEEEFNPKNLSVYAVDKPSNMKMDSKQCPIYKNIIEKFIDPENVSTQQIPSPIGQLDLRTTGLLLWCNNGDFGRLICIPGNIPKTYDVSIRREMKEFNNKQFVDSDPNDPLPNLLLQPHDLDEDGFKSRFSSVAIIKRDNVVIDPVKMEKAKKFNPNVEIKPMVDEIWRVQISSGKNHVVKRLFQKTGNCVRELRRMKIGSLTFPNCMKEDPKGIQPEKLYKYSVEETVALWNQCGGAKRLHDLKVAELLCRYQREKLETMCRDTEGKTIFANRGKNNLDGQAGSNETNEVQVSVEYVYLKDFIHREYFVKNPIEGMPPLSKYNVGCYKQDGSGWWMDCYTRFPGLSCEHSLRGKVVSRRSTALKIKKKQQVAEQGG